MSNKYVQLALFAVVIVAIQVAGQATGNATILTPMTMSAYYTLLVLGLCMLIGYAGQISLGHAGFFAIGGYISAFLTTFNLVPYKGKPLVALLVQTGIAVERSDLYGEKLLVVRAWPACVLAVATALVIAYLVGKPVLKLKGHYLAMATLGFGIIVYRVVLGTSFLGAADGITDVPALSLTAGVAVTGKAALRVANYYLAWGVVLVGMILLMNLVESRVGRALAAIHGAEDAADSMGISTAGYKLKVFVLSAGFAALAGVLTTHFNGGIGPSEASIMKSVRYVAIVAIGGMSNLWGALVMSLVLNFLSLRGTFGTYDDAVFGGILIIIMLFTPDGLIRRHLFDDLKSVFRQSA